MAKGFGSLYNLCMADVTQMFLKEVDDALHEERLLSVWKNYKPLIVGGVAALVLATAGWQVWLGYERKAAEQVAEQWQGLSDLDAGAKQAVLEEVSDSGSVGFRALARSEMASAALAANPHEVAEAAAAYGAMVADGKSPSWVANMGRLNRALALLGVDNAAAKADLMVLQGQADSALMPPALELLAVLATAEGDTPTARNLTNQLLALPDIPADMRQRASIRLGALSTLTK